MGPESQEPVQGLGLSLRFRARGLFKLPIEVHVLVDGTADLGGRDVEAHLLDDPPHFLRAVELDTGASDNAGQVPRPPSLNPQLDTLVFY